MAGVNKVILVGNLGKKPEIRHLENGRAVANCTIATSETYKNKNGERVTNTEWHNIVLWTPLAEIADKYLDKGSQIYVEGKLTNRSYDDKDGIKRYISEVVVQNLTMLGSKSDNQNQHNDQQSDNYGQQQPQSSAVHEHANESGSNSDDDLPF